MAAEINRKRLRRGLLLPEDAGDARIAAALRRQVRRLPKCRRPFSLPKDADLEGCLAAMEKGLRDDEEFLDRLGDELSSKIEEMKARYDARCKAFTSRYWCFMLVLQAASDTSEPKDLATMKAEREERELAEKKAKQERRLMRARKA